MEPAIGGSEVVMSAKSESSRNLPRVLYIAGYGRSGSTVLDVLLGAHQRTVSVGEMTYVARDWSLEGRGCACGKTYVRCPFWEGALAQNGEPGRAEQVIRAVEHRKSLFSLLSGRLPLWQREGYRKQMRALFRHAARKGEAEIVVDSSKSARHAAGRFWALREVAGLDVQVLHLVRDGRSTLRSVVEKGSNWALEGHRKEKSFLAERTLLGWGLANSIAWGLGRALGRGRYLRVKFEDLLRAPEETLREIGDFMGVSLDSVVRKINHDEPVEVGHNVGGNRVRLNRTIRLQRDKAPNPRPWTQLDRYHRMLFATSGQWLNLALGYDW